MLKRSYQLLLLLVLFTFAARLYWGHRTQGKLEQAFEPYGARQVPLLADDFARSALPPGQDGTLLWNKAMAALTPTDSPRNSNLEYSNYPPYPSQWWHAAEASEQANASAIQIAHEASKFPLARFVQGTPSLFILLPHLNSARALANALADSAVRSHLKNNHLEAIDRLLSTERLARAILDDPFAVSTLVGIGISALTCDSAQVIAPGLPHAISQSTELRAKVIELINRLLDDDAYLASLDTSILAERAVMQVEVQSSREKRLLLRPAHDLYTANVAQRTFDAHEKLSSRDPMQMLTLARSSPTIPTFPGWSGFGNWYARSTETLLRVCGERRLTAVSLAIQLYRADHGLQFPESLNALVPTYLQTLPRDPFDPNRAPVGYWTGKNFDPAGSSRPLLYLNDGPHEPGQISPNPMFSWQRDRTTRPPREHIRQYRDVSRFDPPRAESPSAEDEH